MLTAGARFGAGSGRIRVCPDTSEHPTELAGVQLPHLLSAQHQPSGFLLQV
jgi:hypothetical protein